MRRWPGIRHARWLWHSHRLERWVHWCALKGIGLGVANENDLAVLDAIWRGDA